MASTNTKRWIRFEHRAREPGDNPTVRSNYVVGAYSKIPPAAPQNPQAIGGLAQVILKWDHVDKDAAGKPLQALARYIVYYKAYIGAIPPTIDIDSPGTYDDAIIVDNNTISLAAGRMYNEQTGQWEDMRIAARIAAIDRSGRRGLGSAQVQAAPAISRVANVVSMGIIEAPSGGYPENKQWTKVWNNISVSVPWGYRYIVVVLPWSALSSSINLMPMDYSIFSSHIIYGLFSKPGYLKPYLDAGTHHNVTLYVYHYGEVAAGAYCSDGEETALPEQMFDFNAPGNLRLSGQLIEADPTVVPTEFYSLDFEPVIWFVYQVPL